MHPTDQIYLQSPQFLGKHIIKFRHGLLITESERLEHYDINYVATAFATMMTHPTRHMNEHKNGTIFDWYMCYYSITIVRSLIDSYGKQYLSIYKTEHTHILTTS